MILIGPGGTGKTTVLRAAEALIDHFDGSDSVRKCAFANTAARLLQGDTLHALCKLPLTDLQQRTGRLRLKVLKQHRLRWKTAVAMFIDEISMVAADQFLQTDVRARQAKELSSVRFGGLGVILSGDFLQLPPVEKKGLAHPINDNGTIPNVEDDEHIENLGCQEQATGEARQGLDLWRSIRNVVSLEVNIRAPDVLSRLQTEMRKGDISADMWNLYLSRVLLPNDERLLEAPFSTERVQYIVHRHRLRIRQSYRNAVEECKLTGKRLYVIKAADEVKEIDRPRFTAAVRRELTDLANPRHTKFIPSILQLYTGMRLLLYLF